MPALALAPFRHRHRLAPARHRPPGWRHRPRPPAPDRSRLATDRHGHGTAARTAPATASHRHGKTWRSAGTVAAGFEQKKSRQPVREAGKGKRPALKRGRRLGWVALLHARNGCFGSDEVAGRKLLQREPPCEAPVNGFNPDLGHDCAGPEEADEPRTNLGNHSPPSLSRSKPSSASNSATASAATCRASEIV